MAIRDIGGLFDQLENLQEEEVWSTLQEVLRLENAQGRAVCTCDRCMVDMLAFSLNHVPPRYVADRYNKFPMGDATQVQDQKLIVEAIRSALARIGQRPHHP